MTTPIEETLVLVKPDGGLVRQTMSRSQASLSPTFVPMAASVDAGSMSKCDSCGMRSDSDGTRTPGASTISIVSASPRTAVTPPGAFQFAKRVGSGSRRRSATTPTGRL